MTTRRRFIKTAGLGGAAALAAPAIVKAQAPIKWRFQTYAGGALGEHVTKPMVDYVNNAANGEMEIELFYADQIVPTGELFQALQRGTIDAVHSDDDSMASPTPLRQFGGYFPFATKHILDVPVLFNQYGLADIWRSEYEKVGVNVDFGRRTGSVQLQHQEGDHVARRPRRQEALHLPDRRPLPGQVRRRAGHHSLRGRRGRGADRRARRHGMVGHHRGLHRRLGRRDRLLPDQQHLGRLDRVVVRQPAALGRTARPPQAMVMAATEAGHTYRNQWYWGGEARLRARATSWSCVPCPQRNGPRSKNAAKDFWNEVAEEGEIQAKIVEIFREYNEVINQAGRPYPTADRLPAHTEGPEAIRGLRIFRKDGPFNAPAHIRRIEETRSPAGASTRCLSVSSTCRAG
jgi:hypothetical protein